ncbi:ABC-type zinc uptake system substrate-binding component ZntA [Thermosynechococcus sp. NK55a]|uniref:metal ABC transporter substrate-binding protein n=1 Tax=Thermosynechococcus sp. NK55a TaxID=1394889 RepID=UPI0003D8E7E3|nr:metal ABC transporter substrate-binding protein [Thermosynechococcus sp. NK55a]AHB88939.1 ABC-type zinc uptake system substrate-binding component ZntA [Thermosynechococcus sp. NK55a]
MAIQAHLKRWGLLLILGVFLGSCAPQAQSPQEQETSQTEAPLTIVTTFLPITAFTKAVAGDRATVEQLLPPNVDAHDLQARPEDVRLLGTARVLVKNGLGLETFLDPLIKNAANTDLKVIDTSAGVTPIANTKGNPDHAHDHDDHSHSHSHGEFNPHIWLDPQRAVQQVKNIRDGLIAVDPEGAAIYEKNSAAFIQKLEALDALAREKLTPFAGKTFVVYHDVAPYFAERYNLKAIYLVGIPAVNPSPADVQRVMQAVRQSDLKTLLTEPGQEQGFESLAQDSGAKVSVFDPLERAPSAADLTPAYFLGKMEQNILNLAEAFGAQRQAHRSPYSLAVLELAWIPL